MCSEGCVRENEKSFGKSSLQKFVNHSHQESTQKFCIERAFFCCFIKKREHGKIQDQKYELKKITTNCILNYSVEWEKFTEI